MLISTSTSNKLTPRPRPDVLFQVTGAFGEFERSMIRERVNAGLARATAEGKTLGRPKNDDAKQRAAVVRLRKRGVGILKIARPVGAGTSYVQRILAELEHSS
jgi:DNA invertase Pin-like site-specific DNA recombinase